MKFDEISILSGGKLVYGADARLRCAYGEKIQYGITVAPTVFTDWMIDCSQIQSIVNGSSVEYVNPTCRQLEYGGGAFGALHTKTCGGLPIRPPMLSTRGSS